MEKRDFELLNRHGKRMPATLRLPTGEQKGTMILLHGLGGWKDQPHMVAVADQATAHGYAVLMFDASDGANGPDADFFNTTNTGYVEDVVDVVESVRTAEWFKAPLVFAGHSQGGLIALNYVAHHGDNVARLVLIAPAVSWMQGAWAWLPLALPWLITGSMPWRGPHGINLKLGRAWLLDFFRFSGERDARHVHVPTLIISAKKDETVGKPYTHRTFSRRFENARHITLRGADHDFDGHEAELADIVTKWLTSS
jgi:pimeloyl-ACP methyl ester carboxylesterase